MQLPQWLTIAVAAMVIFFGVHRLRISMRSVEAEQRAVERGGLYGMKRRTHRIIGIAYVLLGAGLVATSFGWNPLARWTAPTTRAADPGLLQPLRIDLGSGSGAPVPAAGSGSASAPLSGGAGVR
jgi:hypothetical protein